MTCGTQLVQEKEGGKGDSRWPQRNLLPRFEGCGLGEEGGKGYTRNLGKPGGKNWRAMAGGLLEAKGTKPVDCVPQFHLEGLRKEDPVTER